MAVERPDKVGREEILRVHLERQGLPIAEDVIIEHLASATTGFTGADLANLVNEVSSMLRSFYVGTGDFLFVENHCFVGRIISRQEAFVRGHSTGI